jgi:hypothetical protein
MEENVPPLEEKKLDTKTKGSSRQLNDLAVPWRLMIAYTWKVCFNWRQVRD